MGKRGPKPQKGVATPGGGAWGLPIEREQAEDALGQRIEEATWEEIERAHVRFQGQLQMARESFRDVKRDSRGVRSYETMREKVMERLTNSLSELHALDHEDLFALDNNQFNNRLEGRSPGPPEENLLIIVRDAAHLVQRARLMVRDADPVHHSMSEAESKAAFCQTLQGICAQAGLPAKTSGGGSYEYATPKPFERLILALDVHAEQCMPAWLKWLHGALRG